MDVEKIIEKTVNQTITKLRMSGMLKESLLNTYQKCEELLRSYNLLRASEDETAKRLVKKIDNALLSIESDPYYDVIIKYYMLGDSRDSIAELFDTTGTTITRNKERLIKTIAKIIFTDDFIHEIFGDTL